MLPIDHNWFSWLIVLNIFLYFLPSLHTCDMSSYLYYQLIIHFPSSLKNGGNQKKNSKSSNHIYPGSYSWVYGDTIVACLLWINTPSCSPRSTSILYHPSYSPFLSHSRIIRQQFSQLSPVSSFFSLSFDYSSQASMILFYYYQKWSALDSISPSSCDISFHLHF